MPTVRSFWAYDLPAPVLSAAERVQEKWRSQYPGFKWVEPRNIHLTLHFLGDIQLNQINPMTTAFKTALCNEPAPRLSLGAPGVFPNWHNPRVLWISLAGDVESLKEMHRKTGQVLQKLKFPLESRPFSPHITLARISQNEGYLQTDMSEIQKYSTAIAGDFYLDRLTLYASKLTPQGPIYTVQDVIALKNPN